MSALLITFALQLGGFGLASHALHMNKTDALIFSSVIVGLGTTAYNLMDIAPSPAQGRLMAAKCAPGWAGQAIGIGAVIVF